jgi:hypothetical protein
MFKHLLRYKEFFNGTEMETVTAFIKNEMNTFSKYEELINYYNNFQNRIIIENDLSIQTTLFEVNRKDFLKTVINNVVYLKNMLLNELVLQYQKKVKK